MRGSSCRLAAVIAAAVMGAGVLCSCAGKTESSKPVKVDEKFSGRAVMTVDGTEYTADVQRGGADMWQWEFSAPQTIEGMTVTCSGESTRFEFMGLSYETERGNIPEGSAMTLTAAAMDKLIAQKGVTAVVNDKGVTTVSGEVKGQEFSAKFKDGKITSLDISSEVSVKFEQQK